MIENLIYERLTSDPSIAGVLAKYDKRPAVFLSQTPQDTDPKWAKSQYPRVEFILDTQYSPDRNASGVLVLHISCIENQSVAPEDITKFFIDCLSGVFFTPQGQITVSALWKRTDMFESGTDANKQPRILGATIEFELLEFPARLTINPDPVIGAIEWARKHTPQAKIIGHDTLPEIFVPNDTAPALYFRSNGLNSLMRNTYAVAWMQTTVICHIFATTLQGREMWGRSIADKLSIEGEIVLDDKSPMLLERILIHAHANPLSEGQLQVVGQYGVLRDTIHDNPLSDIQIQQQEVPTDG